MRAHAPNPKTNITIAVAGGRVEPTRGFEARSHPPNQHAVSRHDHTLLTNTTLLSRRNNLSLHPVKYYYRSRMIPTVLPTKSPDSSVEYPDSISPLTRTRATCTHPTITRTLYS